MKRIITLLALLTCLFTLNLSAQTFGGGVSITGTTNSQLVNGGTVSTNTFYITLPPKTVTLSNIVNTNETVIFSYGVQVVGETNVTLIGSITNSFSLANGGTNGGSWSTNIPQQSIAIEIVPYAQAAIGAFTNTIYVP